MNKEKLLHHIKHLEEEHQALDKQVKEGYSHFLNDADLNKAKYQRLQIKRELETLKHQYNQAQIKH